MPYRDPDKRREYDRKRKRKYFNEHPEAGFNTAMSVWNKNPTRVHARQVVYYALKVGKLVRPDTCSECGRTGCTIQAHHLSYDDPMNVVWLCIPCHKQADRKRQTDNGENPDNMRRLTDEQVREIRMSDKSDRQLATIYNISNCSINRIRNYLTYKDVSD